MRKQEFISTLRARLSGLPPKETEECVGFYSEMIDDRIEEGLSEETAVSSVGSIDDIVSQTVVQIPLFKIAKEKIKPKRRLKAWEITLLALGSPIWISIIAAILAVAISLYVALWSVVVSVWAVFVSLAACSFSGAVGCIAFAFTGNALTGFAILGAGFVCAGLSVFTFYGSKEATKGALLLTKRIILGIKCCFIKKEVA